MITYCLKFPDKNTAIDAGLLVENDGEYIATNQFTVDIIGKIPKLVDNGQTNNEGTPIYEATYLDGYHINILTDSLPAGLEEYRALPTKQYRIFLGV